MPAGASEDFLCAVEIDSLLLLLLLSAYAYTTIRLHTRAKKVRAFGSTRSTWARARHLVNRGEFMTCWSIAPSI